MTEPRQLNYSPQPPLWHRRRRVRRWLLLGTVGLVLLSAWWWFPPLWRNFQALRWERQCMTYAAPADQVVYEKGEAAARDRPGVGRFAGVRCWDEFYTLVRWHEIKAKQPVLFLHGRRWPGGNPQLVAVEYEQLSEFDLVLSTHVPYPAGPFQMPEERLFRSTLGIPPGAAKGTLRFFAGQPDPTDDSHFTIGYEIGGRGGTIDGWLRAHQTLDLRVRDGPLKR